MKSRKRARLTTALTPLSIFLVSGASAQTPADAGAGDSAESVDEVIVYGIRQSMAKSLNQKRANNSQIDVISAEDVTKFPDVNIAESLSRLPGVTVDRGYAEGEKISILGVDSRLISTTLDGQPVASAEWQPAQIDAGRSFNFSTVAPELIASAEVYKSPQARLYEGGVGGTINMVTRKPLDLKPNTASMSLSYNRNMRTDADDPRGSLLYSWHNEADTFGALFLAAYNKTQIGGSSVGVLGGYQNACGWWASANPIRSGAGSGGCTNGAFNNPGALPAVTNGGPALTPTMLVPASINQGAFIQDRTRKTGYVALQWKATDNLEFTGSWLSMKGDYSNYSQSMYTEVGVGWDDRQLDGLYGADANRLTYTSVETNQYGITGGVTSHMAVREDNYYKHSTLDNDNYNLGMKWTPENWVIEARFGSSKATGGSDPEYFLNWYGTDAGSWSLGTNSSNLSLTTPLTDPSVFHILNGQQAGFVKSSVNTDDIEFARLDFERDVEWGMLDKLLFGAAATHTQSHNKAHFYNTRSTANITIADLDHFTTPSSWISGLGASGDLVSYVDVTQQATIDYSASHKDPGNANGDYRDAGNLWDVDEKDTAAYVQANFRSGRFHGDLGVRAVHTTSDQTYRSTLDWDPWYEEMVTQKQTYTKVLPALNTVFDLDEHQLLRFTAAKVMARPGFKELSGQIEFSIDRLTGNGGNPFLRPYQSLNLGASYEWYFSENGLFNVDLFYRGITDYIVMKTETQSVILPQEAIDHCNADTTLACYPRSNPMNMLVTTPTNLDKAHVSGISLGWQGDIGAGFGVAANVTLLDVSTATYSTDGGTDAQGNPVEGSTAGKLQLPYFSKTSYTVAPYYEKGPVQARLSYTWRSKYISGYSAGAYGGYSSEDLTNYTDAWGELDGQVSYDIISERLQATLSAQNLLDETVKPYTTGNLPLGWNRYGRRVSLGITYNFK